MYPSAAAVAAAAARHPGPPQPGQPFKFTVGESCDRIKEEFSFLQAQYHNLKLECEKLATEKIEIQRHYVMYYEMSYGLNVEMHKQTEISKRLSAIIGQILPFLSQEHQAQVAQAVERAKSVTMTELNSVVGQQRPDVSRFLQQLQLPPGAPLGPHPNIPGLPGLGPPGGLTVPTSASAALLGLGLTPGAPPTPGSTPNHPLSMLSKPDLHRGQPDDLKSNGGLSSGTEERHRSSVSPADKYSRPRSPPDSHHGHHGQNHHDHPIHIKKLKKESDKDMGHQSDGEKSDQDLVVDDASDCPTSPVVNGTSSPRENGIDKLPPLGSQSKKDIPPHSPRSGTSSNASTPSAKKMEEREKATTPNSKPMTPNSNSVASLKPTSSKSLQGPPPPSALAAAYPAHYPPGPPPHHLPPGAQHHPMELMGYNGYGAPRGPPTLQQQLYDPHGVMRVPTVPVASVPGGKPDLYLNWGWRT